MPGGVLGTGFCAATTATPPKHAITKSNPEQRHDRIILMLGASVTFSGSLRPRMRSRAAVGHAQSPPDRFKIHFADVGITPGLFGMAQGGVEDATLPVHLGPSNGKVMIVAVNPWIVFIIQFCGLEAEQDIHLVARPFFGLVDL